VDGSTQEATTLVQMSLESLEQALTHPLSIPLASVSGRTGVLELVGQAGIAVAWPRIRVGAVGTAALPPHDVLLIFLDTFRADMLEGSPALAPNLAAFARKNLHFTTAMSTSSWTVPAVISTFTGLYPSALGMDHAIADGQMMLPIPSGASRLEVDLRRAGWDTWAIQTNPFLSYEDIKVGFRSYTYQFDGDAEEITAGAVKRISSPSCGPSFGYVHYLDPHLPYEIHPGLTVDGAGTASGSEAGDSLLQEASRLHQREPVLRWARTPERRQLIRRLYEGEVRHLDQQLGRLFEALEATGRMARTLVVIVSDHGEELWDHGGFEHGHGFHREVNEALMILHLPKGLQGQKPALGGSHRSTAGQQAQPAEGVERSREGWLSAEGTSPWRAHVMRRPASLVDIRKTVLSVLGLEAPSTAQGRNLLSEKGWNAARARFGEGILYGEGQRTVREGAWKLILGPGAQTRLYDLSSDAWEHRNRSAEKPGEVARLKALLVNHQQESLRMKLEVGADGARTSGGRALEPELREQLRALGYVQ